MDMFQDLLDEYERLEPNGFDAWNPLRNERELWHRIRLMISLNKALQKIDIPMKEIRVLDVGCGVGRSTRALIEFGIKPENILGIDLRSSAIEQARKSNPAIAFRVVKGFQDWPSNESFHLCLQCTAFSSIKGDERRIALGGMMEKTVTENGYIFWWDRIRANGFAGGDLLIPARFFTKSKIVDEIDILLKPSILDVSTARKHGNFPLLKKIQNYFGDPPTHLYALLRKGM